jgi:tartrate-resistant acid phosphatase type 5
MKYLIFILVNYINLFDCEERTFRNSLLRMNKIKDTNSNFNNLSLTIDHNQVNFFAIGDWGGLPSFPYKTVIEMKASKQIDDMAKMYNTHFQLGLGDNFYYSGVKDVNDKRFNYTFENVFSSDYQKKSPWFMIAGNHDYYGNIKAQIDYTYKSNRWIYPDYHYTIDVKNNINDDPFIKILALDTILLCGGTLDKTNNKAPKFNSKKETKDSRDHWKMVENELKTIYNSNFPYVFVAGHYPVWSIAEHGPTKCLVDKLRPLLHKYKVTAYLCGHDHNLQHLSDVYMNHRVEYVLSGASCFSKNSTKHTNDVPDGSLKFHWNDPKVVFNGGFALLRVSNNNLTITYFETEGHNLFQTVVYPRK